MGCRKKKEEEKEIRITQLMV